MVSTNSMLVRVQLYGALHGGRGGQVERRRQLLDLASGEILRKIGLQHARGFASGEPRDQLLKRMRNRPRCQGGNANSQQDDTKPDDWKQHRKTARDFVHGGVDGAQAEELVL